MDLKEELENYVSSNEEEETDRLNFIDFLNKNVNAFERENATGHITASAWVINKEHTKTLFCFHNIFNSWSWLGGHADGEKDLLAVALKEVKEESGLTELCILDKNIFSVEIIHVQGHYKKGKYVSSHLHYNVTYLLEADENAPLKIKEDENKGLAWFLFEEVEKASSEPWMTEHIYSKLIKKTSSY